VIDKENGRMRGEPPGKARPGGRKRRPRKRGKSRPQSGSGTAALSPISTPGARRAAARADTPVYAAVDLGSNNCRLLIARPRKHGQFRVIDSFSRIVRLGEGVAASGMLSPAAIERTVRALKICAARIAAAKATHVQAIATEACRRAGNADLLRARVLAETGLSLEIVSVDEEAALAATGCAPLIGKRYGGALVFDIGGGSTEVIWIRRENGVCHVLHAESLPVGVVGLAERRDGARDRAFFDTVLAEMTDRFAKVRARLEQGRTFAEEDHHLLGTSGTVTTLAGIALGLPRYIRSRVDGSWHTSARLLAVTDDLLALDPAARARLGCVGKERADLIVPGCAIFSAIYATWPCAELRVADRGLREGMLRRMMNKQNAAA
jgi:exopolyphosphatase/guanosine-5'-triphosphate,3'-diphosphate pyrophosphatase